MLSSFRFTFFLLLSLSFVVFNACATDSFVGEFEQTGQWQNNPCLMMLSKEFKTNKEEKISYEVTFFRGGPEGLRSIAGNERAKDLYDEGVKWRKYCPGMTHTWFVDIYQGIEENPRNPFLLSYAVLYAFFHAKGQLEAGSPMKALWEDLFLSKKAKG